MDKQEKLNDFIDNVIYANLDNPIFNELDSDKEILEDAIQWIAGNLNPEEVFGQYDLDMWAKYNGWMETPE